jgi:hypothetical protein
VEIGRYVKELMKTKTSVLREREESCGESCEERSVHKQTLFRVFSGVTVTCELARVWNSETA